MGVFCILSVVCGFFGRGGSVMGWLVSRSVSSILFSRLEGFLDRGWGLSLSGLEWWWRLVFPGDVGWCVWCFCV